MKSVISKALLAVGVAVSLLAGAASAQAYYYYHGYYHGGYYRYHRPYVGYYVYPGYRYYHGCRWVPGHYGAYGRWHPAHKICW